MDHTKQGQSKGGILAKACEYINELTTENGRMADVLKENEMLSNELEVTRQQLFEVKNENKKLRNLLARHGLLDTADTNGNTSAVAHNAASATVTSPAGAATAAAATGVIQAASAAATVTQVISQASS